MALRITNVELSAAQTEELKRAEERMRKETALLREQMAYSGPSLTKMIRDIERSWLQDQLSISSIESTVRRATRFDSSVLDAMHEVQRQYAREIEQVPGLAAATQISGLASATQEIERSLREQHESMRHPLKSAFGRMREQLAAFEALPEMSMLKSGLAQAAESISGAGRAWMDPLSTSMQSLQESIRTLVDRPEYREASTAFGRLVAQVRDLDYSAVSDARSIQHQMRTISWQDVVEAAVELREHQTQEEIPSAGQSHPARRPAPSLSEILQVLSFIVTMIVLFYGDNQFGRTEHRGDSADSDRKPSQEMHQQLQIAVATQLFTEPSAQSDALETLSPGTWIRLIETRKTWLLIEVEIGESSHVRGWISKRATRPIYEPIFEAALEQLQASIADQLPALVEERPLSMAIPSLIVDAGDATGMRYVEFFTASIRNANTRSAYWHACGQFFAFCDARNLKLVSIQPVHVAAYIEQLMSTHAAPTVKQHLAGIRRMFDYLVLGQVIPTSPAASVRGPKHVVSEGKTPILDADETRRLFAQFDVTLLADLRDRAVLGAMTFGFARVGALVKLRVRDYYRQGTKVWLILQEKGGKQNRVPVHHLAAEFLEAYIDKANIGLERDSPLFRSFGRGKGRNQVTDRGLSRGEIFTIVRRRAAAAGLPPEIGCHSFRGTGITNYLSNGGTIEIAAKLAGHSSTRTTQLYDRRRAEVALAEIERIRF